MKTYQIEMCAEYIDGVASKAVRLSLREKLGILFHRGLYIAFYTRDAWKKRIEEDR